MGLLLPTWWDLFVHISVCFHTGWTSGMSWARAHRFRGGSLGSWGSENWMPEQRCPVETQSGRYVHSLKVISSHRKIVKRNRQN